MFFHSSRALDPSASVFQAQPRCGALHSHPLPLALGHHQPHFPAGRPHAAGVNRSRVSKLTEEKFILDVFYTFCVSNTSVFFVPTVRSNLIPSPPTFNSKYDYLSWESYYNLSYYTRLLPPVPKDCPTPLGVKG